MRMRGLTHAPSYLRLRTAQPCWAGSHSVCLATGGDGRSPWGAPFPLRAAWVGRSGQPTVYRRTTPLRGLERPIYLFALSRAGRP